MNLVRDFSPQLVCPASRFGNGIPWSQPDACHSLRPLHRAVSVRCRSGDRASDHCRSGPGCRPFSTATATHHSSLRPVSASPACRRGRGRGSRKIDGVSGQIQGVRLRRDLGGAHETTALIVAGPRASKGSTGTRARRLAGEAERFCRPAGRPYSAGSDGARARDFVTEDYLVFSITALDDHARREDSSSRLMVTTSPSCSAASASRSAARNGRRCCVTASRISRATWSFRPGTPRSSTTPRPAPRRRRDPRVRELATAGVPLLRRAARRASWPASTRSCRRPAGSTAVEAGATRARRAQVHSLFIDVNELTDGPRTHSRWPETSTRRALFALAATVSASTVEGQRPGEAEDARRHLPLRRRAERAWSRGEFLELASS